LADTATTTSTPRPARPVWAGAPGFVWALLLYVGIALVHYRDVLVAPTQRVLGGGDAYNYIWRIWWWAGGFTHWGGDPWFAPQITSPIGHHLAEAELTPLNLVPAVLIAKVVGPVVAYTTVGFASLVLAGLFMYLYACSLRASRLGSTLAGVLFMSAPYMAFHWLGHVPLMGVWTLPLGLTAIERLADALSSGRKRHAWWLAAGFGAALGLAGWSSWYYLVMFGVAFAVYALVRLRPTRTGLPRRPWGLLALSLGIAVAMVLPVFVLVKLHSVTKMTWPLTRVWGAPPFAYFLPSLLHPIFKSAAFLLGHSQGEDALYVGLVGLVLAVTGFIVYRKRSSAVGPIVWTAAVTYVLSLGPRLYLGRFGGWAKLPFSLPNITVLNVNLHKLAKFGVLLPGAVFSVMPVADGIRQPDRFGVVVLACVAALAALGFDAAAARVRPYARWAVGALFLVLLGFVLFDFASTSIWASTSARPVETWLAQQQGNGSVIWLPNPGIVEDEQIFKTTVTGKPIAFGASTFPPPQIVILKELLLGFPDQASVAALDKAGVRWIVWQKSLAPTPVVPGVYRLAASFSDVDVLERIGKP
jgi:hypothetical protein